NAVYGGRIQSGKIKVIKGSVVVLSGTRRSNCVYTLDGQAVTRNTLKGRKQLGEYHTGWKIKTGNVLDSRNQRSTQQYMKSEVAKHLGVAGIQQQNGLVNETNVTLFVKVTIISDWIYDTYRYVGVFGWLASIKQGMLEPVKVKCIFLGYRKGIVGNKLWRFDDVTSKVVLYRNIGFNESGKYKKTFIGSGVGTGSMPVLQGVEFEVEPHEDHTFEVEPHGNVDHVVVATMEKIYAHESLTFNDTVACEVIFKWKAGLKDDMDARSDVYVLNNGCRKCSDDDDGYYWEYTPAKGNVLGMEIVRDQSDNTLRVSQFRFYNGKLVQTLLEGHSILSLEGSLSRDCDVKNNGKWSCIYAVRSQEYQVVCTRPDIASVGVNMSDGFDRGLQKNVQVFMNFEYAISRSITVYGLMILGCAGSLKANLQHMKALSITEAGYMTFTEAWKKEIWLKRLLAKSGYELSLVAGIATGALVKGDSWSEVPA
ncbi:hypothetical protein Tco_1486068, partial [Tanacetum coccineum]